MLLCRPLRALHRGAIVPVMRFFTLLLTSICLATTATAQLNAAAVQPGFYTDSGDCLLTDGSVTLRSQRNQMAFHYDLAGQLMAVDVLVPLSTASPFGGFVLGGKTYYQTPAGLVLDPESSVFSIESSGSHLGTSQGYFYNQDTQTWFEFTETLCTQDRAALLAQSLNPLKEILTARIEVDILTEFSSVQSAYFSAMKAAGL